MTEQLPCSQPSDIAPVADLSAEWLNSSCFCISLDRTSLAHALSAELASPQIRSLLEERIPAFVDRFNHLFV